MNGFYKLILLVLVFSLIYTYSLDKVPVHLNRDELGFSLNAYSIVKTGFDENGRFLPLYFWHLGVIWATPIIVYLTAIFLYFIPLSEITIRLPAVLIGLINITLIYFLAKRVFNNKNYALFSATLLALNPIHFIQSRILLDNLFPIPFILGWILLLYFFVSNNKIWILFFAGFLLGFGIHSYHATKVIMPLYILFTFFLILMKLKTNRLRSILVLLFGFILPLLPLIPWLSQYPDTLIDQVKYTNLYDTKLSPIQGLVTLLNPQSIGKMVSVYFKYFNPLFLFFKGDSSLIHSTGKAGVFLLPYALLLPVGLFLAIKNKGWFSWLLIFGFFTAPIAASLVSHEYRASKILFILPFGTLLVVTAVKYMMNSRQKLLRIFCLILIISIPIQFSIFLFDYFNDYRARSYVWFDYDIPGAMQAILEEENIRPANLIYFDSRIYYYTERYWRFNLIKQKREDLFHKALFFDPLDPNNQLFGPNTIVLYRFDHIDNLPIQVPPLRLIRTILEPDGIPSFYIYRN